MVRDFTVRDRQKCQDKEVQLSCPVGGTPTEEPVCIVLASSLWENPR
jgi:hypothetical protein